MSMNHLHSSNGKLRIWLIIILVTIAVIVMGVQPAFAGFCWAG
jgi:hypothetical protein